MANPEGTNEKRWSEAIAEKLNIWTHNLIDTPMITEGGVVCHKKPFDRIFVFSGLSVEFKYVKGISFDLYEWKTNIKTRHQYRDMKRFEETDSGISILYIFFKIAGKRDLQKKWERVGGLGGDRIYHYDMRDLEEIENYMKEMVK